MSRNQLKILYKYITVYQTKQNFIMFIIVLGQHVLFLTESSSGPSKNTDPYLVSPREPPNRPVRGY